MHLTAASSVDNGSPVAELSHSDRNSAVYQMESDHCTQDASTDYNDLLGHQVNAAKA